MGGFRLDVWWPIHGVIGAVAPLNKILQGGRNKAHNDYVRARPGGIPVGLDQMKQCENRKICVSNI